MEDHASEFVDLSPIRLRSAVLLQIGQLSEERRRLLADGQRFHDPRGWRERLKRLDADLEELWQVRRKELR